MDSIKVYHTIETVRRKCEYGSEHSVALVITKIIYPSPWTWLCDNGYEKSDERIYVDYQGRKYKRMVTIDYSNNVYYLEGDKPNIWYPRMPYNGKLAY